MRRSFCGSHRERVEAAVALQGARRRRRISLELDEFERPGGRALVEDSPEVEAYLAALSMGPSRPMRRASIDCPRVAHTLEESPEEGVKEPSGNEAPMAEAGQEQAQPHAHLQSHLHSHMPSHLASHLPSHLPSDQQQEHQQRQHQYQRQYQHRHQQQHQSRSDAVESDADSKHVNAPTTDNRETSQQQQQQQAQQGGDAGSNMDVMCQSAMAEREPRRPERPQRSSDSQRTRSLLFSARRACASFIRRKDSNSSVAANPAMTERSVDLDVDAGASGVATGKRSSCSKAQEGSAPEAVISDTWAGDGKLKEWVDWSIVDKALQPPELMQAQAALIAGSRSTGCLVPATAATSNS